MDANNFVNSNHLVSMNVETLNLMVAKLSVWLKTLNILAAKLNGFTVYHSFELLLWSGKLATKNKKLGTLHEFACHPCCRGHANLLCIVPTLVYVVPKHLH